jgi:hypothetical protein
MRSDKELAWIVAAAIKTSNGQRPDQPMPIDIIANGPAEAIRIL